MRLYNDPLNTGYVCPREAIEEGLPMVVSSKFEITVGDAITDLSNATPSTICFIRTVIRERFDTDISRASIVLNRRS